MEQIKNAIDVVESLETKYELTTDEIKKMRELLVDFKVFVPLIGRFSAGKSALINNILGWNTEVCKENIGVETAIPTEIFAGKEDIACICRPEKQYVSMEQFLDIRDSINAQNAEVVKLQLMDNDILEQFPNVALVDMPGLDSGYEIHDKAIEYYIRKSMAYILVFPADELTIPQSMEPILNDLNIYDMPMCVVITKGNRIIGVEEQRKNELKKSLRKYFHDKTIQIFITEKENGRVEDVVNYLVSVEQQANDLGKVFYRKKLEPEFARICNYLVGYLKNMELSMSQLEEEQERLNYNMKKLNGAIDEELGEFERQIPKLINDIAMDVQAALSARMDEYVSELLHDVDISGSINETVRTTLTSSYQTRVMEKLQKRLEKISEVMSLGSSNYASSLMIDIDKVCGKEISGIGRTAIDAIALVFGPIGAIVAHLITGQINKNISEKRREAEMKVRQQLSSSVFPSVDREVRTKLEIDLNHISMDVRKDVEKDVATQMESLQKALKEVIEKKKEEDTKKENKRIEIEDDICLVEEVRDLIS